MLDEPDLSYVEWEFAAATRMGLPRLMFLLAEDTVELPRAALVEPDRDLDKRQQAFRQRVLNCGVTVRTVRSPEELELAVMQALQNLAPVGAGPPPTAAGLPTPGLVWGRGAEVAAVVGALTTGADPVPVAVLGPPGIGKSTTCLAALHAPTVADRYGPRRWLVRCDGVSDAAALVSVLAVEVGAVADTLAGLAVGVRARLEAGPGVVVLDNLETLWTGDPLAVEEVLRSLASVPGLGLVVTVRGTARPGGVRWRDPVLVGPLGAADARLMFLSVAGSEFGASPALDGLLAELDGVPLAVELLGYAAQGQPDLTELARRWEAERVTMLARFGGASRELSVSTSVELSITSPLMTEPALRLFTLMGQLPDGIAAGDLTSLVDRAGMAAATLRQLGLAFDADGRLRMLAPIREHAAAHHPPAEDDLRRMIMHYGRLATDPRSTVRRDRAAAAETGNVRAMIRAAVRRTDVDLTVPAVESLISYAQHVGAVTTPILEPAMVMAAPLSKAFGDLDLARSHHEQAREHYQTALSLYQQIGSVSGEASCIKGLGDLALTRSDRDQARDHYWTALRLYKLVGDQYSIGTAHQRLAQLTEGPDRRRHVDAARAAWESIGRDDLVSDLDVEPGSGS